MPTVEKPESGQPQAPVAWVTGGTRGLGRAVAQRLAPSHRLALSYRADDQNAAEARHSLEARLDNGGVLLLRGDLSQEGTASRQAAAISERYSRLDAVVHCAAVATFKPILSLKPRELRRILAYSFEAFHQVVLASAEPLGAARGAIVVVSSIGARRTIPGYAGLGAAKAALESYARHLALELGPRQVRVNVVSPGLLRTASLPWLGVGKSHLEQVEDRSPLRRLATAEEAAAVIAFLVSPDASAVTGQVVTVDGGYEIVA